MASNKKHQKGLGALICMLSIYAAKKWDYLLGFLYIYKCVTNVIDTNVDESYALDSSLKLWQSYCPDKGQWVEFDKHQLSEVNLAFH